MSQCRVFLYLSSRGGQGTQKEIETFLGVSHPTVVELVSRMEQNGYIMCWPCKDGRNKNVKLTPKAENIDKDMKKIRINSLDTSADCALQSLQSGPDLRFIRHFAGFNH